MAMSGNAWQRQTWPGVARCCRALPGAAGRCQVLQGVARRLELSLCNAHGRLLFLLALLKDAADGCANLQSLPLLPTTQKQ